MFWSYRVFDNKHILCLSIHLFIYCTYQLKMSTTKVHSYKKNRKVKATQFKKGNRSNKNYLQDRLVSAVHTSDTSTPQSIPDTIIRPTLSEYSDACQVAASTRNTNSVTVPSKLRPKREKGLELTSGASVSEENIIVNLNSLSSLVAGFIHTCENQNPKVQVDKRQGLCITASTKCTTCGFKSTPKKLFTTIKQRRGPDSGSLNDALCIPVLKSKMGVRDIQYIMTCLKCAAADLLDPVWQNKINRAADKVVGLNLK